MSKIRYRHNITEIYDLIKDATIDGDIHKIKQVIRNIISNALKFTKENGSVEVDFTIECKDIYGITAMSPSSVASSSSSTAAMDDDQSNKHHVVDVSDKMKNDSHFFLVMTVKDTGPGITKVLTIQHISDYT